MAAKTATKPTKCENADAHRRAQAKYVAADPAKQRERVKKSAKKHAAAVKQRKKAQNAAHKGKKKTGGRKGRPRTC